MSRSPHNDERNHVVFRADEVGHIVFSADEVSAGTVSITWRIITSGNNGATLVSTTD